MTRSRDVGRGGALFGRLAVAAALALVPCGAGAGAGGGPPSVEEGSQETPPAEAEFRSGIPGLTMVDVRDHRFLWREFEQLQTWEQVDRISIVEFRSKVIEKTSHFLQLDDAAAREFAKAASETVAAIREPFHRSPAAGERQGGVGDRLSAEIDKGVTRMTSLLAGDPRHRLFAPDIKKWLLKLAFGPDEREEAKP